MATPYLLLAAVASLIACSGPTDATTPPTPTAPVVASIEISGSDTLLMGGQSRLTVTARDAQGQVVDSTPGLRLASSDPGVALVSSDGVIRAVGRGPVTISARIDSATAVRAVYVKARVRLQPAPGPTLRWELVLAVGDSVQYLAEFIDPNGLRLGPAPVTAWHSDNPAALSVDSAGWVKALAANQTVRISASTSDGPATTEVIVTDVVAGQPATVQLVHVVEGAGPITFRSNKTPPVTLSFGESATLPVTSGSFQVVADGMPADPYGWRNRYEMITPGATLSVYASTGRTGASLATAWDPAGPIPADSVLVRLIQGSYGLPVIYLLPTAAPLTARPDYCYFDPGDPTPFSVHAASGFDLVVRLKPGFYFDSTAGYARLPVRVPAGHAVTLVLLGNTPSSAHYLTFTDQ